MEKHLSGTPIHYCIGENKSAESILFIHAAFADHTSFDEQVEFFAKDYQVITLDLIGHGKSTIVRKGDNITKTAYYICKLLEFEAIARVHLVGISIGAVLIQDFANKFPDKVASLCCIGGYDINNFQPEWQKENSGEQVKMLLKAIISIKWFAHSNKLTSAVTTDAQERFYQMNIRFRKRSFIYLAQLSKLVNSVKTTNRNYPVMIGCGKYDNPMAIKAVDMWHKSEPTSKMVIFENAGHLVNMDTSQEFNITLLRFLTGEL